MDFWSIFYKIEVLFSEFIYLNQTKNKLTKPTTKTL
jgi:hypothetical protein